MRESARWLMVLGRRSGFPPWPSVVPWMKVTHRTSCMVGNCSGTSRGSASHCSSPTCISLCRPGLGCQPCHSLGLVHRFRSPFPRPQRAVVGQAGGMFCPSFLPFHEVVPVCFLGGVFLLFSGVFRGVCLPKLLFSCYSATQIWGFFGLPRLFLLSGDGFRNLVHSDLRRRSIYICMNKVVSGVWFYGLRARTHRITMSNVE